MTSEVVVMNRVGVALAADSAVTVDMGQSSKVRDSALKVFMLSKYRPVGVMVYNNASLLGVPLETVIKLFRKKLGRKSYPMLHEYGDALVDFLNKSPSLFPKAVQNTYFVDALEVEYERIVELVEKALARGVFDSAEEESPERVAETLDRVIAERLAFWENKADADYYKVCTGDVVGRNSGNVHERDKIEVPRLGRAQRRGARETVRDRRTLGRQGLLPAGCINRSRDRGVWGRGALPGRSAS